jgi:predicted nucleotide-binding protein
MNTFTVKNLEGKKKGDKPSIFIGSSYESLVIAEAVKSMFDENTCEVDIWDEDIFDPSIQKKVSKYAVNERLKNKIIQHRKHYLDNVADAVIPQEETAQDLLPLNIHSLKNFTDIYDFAIFIFVPDDKLVSQSRASAEGELTGTGTRHNVVFELGLFLGRIGSKKTFIIAEDTIKDFIEQFFTDLKGVKTYNYEGNYTNWIKSESENALPYDDASLRQQVAIIQEEIIKTKAEIEIGFLPSTSLAIGLFENMIKLVIENLSRMKSGEELKTQKDDKPFVKPIDLEFPLERTEMILKLVVPDQLSEASHR